MTTAAHATREFPSRATASLANFIVNNLVQTDYQYAEIIDSEAGVFDRDCNGFVGFVLQRLAPAHYDLLPIEADQPRPRVFEYYTFFASLTPESPGGWHWIDFLKDARPGDIIAWELPDFQPGQDTGHVLFVAEMPTMDESCILGFRCAIPPTSHTSTIRAGIDRVGLRTALAPASSSSKLMTLERQCPSYSRLRMIPILNSRAFRSPSAGLNRCKRCIQFRE